jgi:hypothetical protein
MVVAVVLMGVVQMIIHQVVDVIAVGDHLVAAAGAVLVASLMDIAGVAGGAGGGVGIPHLEAVLLDPLTTLVVQVAIV